MCRLYLKVVCRNVVGALAKSFGIHSVRSQFRSLKFRIFQMTFVFVFSVTAKATTPIVYEGVDISPAVEYFSKQVVTLKKPTLVFNWSPSGAKGDGVGLFKKAQKSAASFWKNFGGDPGENIYGPGLYAATDPIVSVKYSESKVNYSRPIDTALLLQMKLPVGFRFLDLSRADKPMLSEVSPELQKLITGNDCTSVSNKDENMKSIFGSYLKYGGSDLSLRCQTFIRIVLQEILQIDGFAYEFASSDPKACDLESSNYLNRAFVITSSGWMRPELIRYYNKNSKHDLENRRQIQTLFINALEENDPVDHSLVNLKTIHDFIQAHPNIRATEFKNSCDEDFCTYSLNYCDEPLGANCDQLVIYRKARLDGGGGLISAKKVVMSFFNDLFWSDLEGLPKSKDSDTWVRENLFGCSGEKPYEEAQ